MKRLKKALCFVLTLALLPLSTLLTACGKTPELSLDTSDAKIYYKLGEEFSSDGLVVNYKEGDETTEVDDYDIDSSAFSTTETGEYTIKVEYEDIEKSYKVYVMTLSVDVTNAQTIYIVGDTFSPAGIVVTATIEDAKVLTAEEYVVDTTMLNMQSPALQVVKIKYQGVETSYQVQVKQLGTIVNNALENDDEIQSVTQTMDSTTTSTDDGMTVTVDTSSRFVISGTQNYTVVNASTTMGTTVIAVDSEQWQTQGAYMKEKATMFGMTSYTEYTDTLEDFTSVEEILEQMFEYVTLEGVEDVTHTISNGVLTVSYTIPANVAEETAESDVVVTIDLETEVITSISVTSLLFSADGETPGTVNATLSTELAEIPDLPTNVTWEQDLYYDDEDVVA